MTQVIYIVSFESITPSSTALYGGVWGAFTSFDKARNQVECWIEAYEETQLDYKEQANGLHVYITNKGSWIIEPTILDD